MPKYQAVEQLLKETYRLGGSMTKDEKKKYEKKKYGFYF